MCILKKKSKPIFMPNVSIIYATFCFVPNCSAPSKQIQYIHCLKTSAFITSLSIYRESWNGPLSSFKHDWSHENPSIPSCTAVTATGWLSPLTDRFQGVFWPRRAFHPHPLKCSEVKGGMDFIMSFGLQHSFATLKGIKWPLHCQQPSQGSDTVTGAGLMEQQRRHTRDARRNDGILCFTQEHNLHLLNDPQVPTTHLVYRHGLS